MPSSDSPATRLATRLAFLVSGFGIACWAPLVPFAKQRLGVEDGGAEHKLRAKAVRWATYRPISPKAR